MLNLTSGSRLDRCYSTPTHAPGYEIDYPPPPSKARSTKAPGEPQISSTPLPTDLPPHPVKVGSKPPSMPPPPLPPKSSNPNGNSNNNMNPLLIISQQHQSVNHSQQNIQNPQQSNLQQNPPNHISQNPNFQLHSKPHFHPHLQNPQHPLQQYQIPQQNPPFPRRQLAGFSKIGSLNYVPEEHIASSLNGIPENSSNDNGTNHPNGGISSTWSAGLTPLDFKASSLLDSHDRFKPERSHRRPVQRMKWSQSRWGRSLAGDLFSYSMGPEHPNSLVGGSGSGGGSTALAHHPNYYGHVSLPPLPVESESRVSSMTIADVSPRLAVKKVLLLYEHAQYREAATFIYRLSVGTFRIILRELPMDVFVEAMPHSLPIMEALYSKVFSAEGPGVELQLLKPEAVVMHIVKFFSRDDMNQPNRNRMKESAGPFTAGCRKILGVIVVAEPTLLKKLLQRSRALDKAVEGMGQHGLVGTTDQSLTPLHEALKLEFQRVVETYKGALHKLEDLSLATNSKSQNKSMAHHHGPAPVSASHQRQLSMRVDEIQERLIKNKSLLNAVEASLDNHCLDILLGILQRRIQLDKESLFQFTQLKKETGDFPSDSLVAPLLMKYSRGCKQVLEMMREVGKELGACLEDYEDDSSDLSGYHSDSDSAMMTSGNSPFITPRARYNFLSRSVRSKQTLRPSLLSSTWSATRSISGKSSGPGSAKSFGGSSFDSSLSGGGSPEDLNRHNLLLNPAHAATPVRPRHVKMKSLLHKNNSLGKVSTASSNGSESSTSGCGTSVATTTTTEGSQDHVHFEEGSTEIGVECVDCVTVVSVPDNQVITQGMNHRCAKGHYSPGTISTSSATSEEVKFAQEMRAEVAALRRQLQAANSTIYHLQEKSKGHGSGAGGIGKGHQGLLRKVNDPQIDLQIRDKDDRKSALVREYGALYAQARVETMDALDALTELAEADELKSKLLFSVVVLAFRSVQTRLAEIKDQVSNLLQFDPLRTAELQPCQSKLVEALSDYLSNSQQKFDQSRCVEHVASQLWTTLYDYPCLRKCEGLLKYIKTCVNLGWGLSNQTPPFVLEYEKRDFSRDLHVRYHSSDPNSNLVKTYLWPALLDGPDGPCVHKGVVIT